MWGGFFGLLFEFVEGHCVGWDGGAVPRVAGHWVGEAIGEVGIGGAVGCGGKFGVEIEVCEEVGGDC